ncbi:MAG TPA: hypothetical protein VEL76_29975 [Gemmataceae bacterium]|nr:hypothetical protein [Gemmataceae bacterium]
MSSLFRSVTIAYRDSGGKKCKKSDPGARKIRIVSKVWYGRYKDAEGNRVTVPLSPDKQRSKEQLAKLMADAKDKELYPEPELTPEEERLRDERGTRHTFISRLAESGVHPKMAQILARHSTITLTMDFYTHLNVHDQTVALEKLPPLPSPQKPKGEEEKGQTGAA